MPTARYGEAVSQASILYCSGAWHWSKPSPVNSPGVTGLVLCRAEGVAEAETVISAPAGAWSPSAAVAATAVLTTRRISRPRGGGAGTAGRDMVEGSWGKTVAVVPQAP